MTRDPVEDRRAAGVVVWILVCAVVAAIVLLANACGLQEVGGGAGLHLPGLGVVYQCERVAETPSGLEEWCWPDDVEQLERELGTSCEPTPRHLGPCLYRCPSATGCNAFSGCWCPDR